MRDRERAGKAHTPELALVGSNASGAVPRMRLPAEPEVADDHRDGEDDVDRIEPVEADLEIGGLLDLHEGDVVEHGRQRDAVENDQRPPR